MSKVRQIKESLRTIAQSKSAQVFNATVKSVEDDTCTVEFGKSTFTGIKLTSTVDASTSKLLVTPKLGSLVTIVDSSGEYRDLQVLRFSDIESIKLDAEEIVINQGDNGGLILIEKLVEKINRLESKLKSHQHAYIPYPGGVAGTPVRTAAGNTAVPPDLTLQFGNTQINELENEKIKH